MKALVILAAALLVTPQAQTQASAATACNATGTAAADFDGDGQDDVAVGDPFAEGGQGAVHLISNGKVVPLPITGLAPGDGAGWSVKLTKVNADNCADLVVGAPYTDVNSTLDAGAVHILYGGAAQDQTTLFAPEPQRGAHLGWSLAASGNLLAMGAPHEDEGKLADTGTVYIRSGESPLRRISQDSVDIRGNSEVGDEFGFSLALTKGRTLFVGVPYENDDGVGRQVGTGRVHSGQVTIISDVTANPLSSQKWDSPTHTSKDRFGYAVAWAEGQGLAVSAPGPGYVALYDANLRPKRTIRQGSGEGFGFSMAASTDGRLAIGAPYGVGVRVVSFTDPAENRVLTTKDGYFGASVVFSGNRLYVGQPDGGRGGRVASAGRNSDSLQTVEPPKGADFGAAVSG
ncbi:FG-GAP repeat protein [Nonomuraea sp. NBC_01738]|uniref:FG-GAP repeat protein n=1 Tax=Nonomuraea sp. NBC_01738 TaxID=2976003 RepID=UPI002E1362C7|nr:FG-GAP repeat protein [Nonomuraea sp. NBC_01738]